MKTAHEVLPTLSRVAGIHLEAYRADHVAERIRRALERERVADVGELAALLRFDARARARFRRSVAVSVSGLFRDREQFDLLERELLPGLLANGHRLRVWSAGFSDGSELYSIATLLDRAGALDRSFLLGSDILEENLELARRGVYGNVTVSPRLRSAARWERRDVVRDGTPPGKWSLVVCRNLAIYLTPEAKTALHERLSEALAPEGILLLGRSERLADPRRLGLEHAGGRAYRRRGAR